MDPGTARKPACRKSSAVMPAYLEGTLSHHDAPPGAPEMVVTSFKRNERSTDFFSHWLTVHPSAVFSATRTSPLSKRLRTVSTVSRTTPVVPTVMLSRSSHMVSIALLSSAWVVAIGIFEAPRCVCACVSLVSRAAGGVNRGAQDQFATSCKRGVNLRRSHSPVTNLMMIV